MYARSVLVVAFLAAAAVGCGGENEPRAQRPAPAVDLSVTAPNDLATVREETVQVEGTVAPANADVLVLGQKAPVSGGGSFSATVSLEPGANVIDVMATAPGRGPALTAFRVTRGQEQDRHREALGAQAARHGQAVHPGHRDVEHDHVRNRALDLGER